MKPNLSPVVIVIGLSLLHVFTNTVVRHDFGAPLKHKYGIDSWILLHPDERERLLLLLLFIIRIMGALIAKMMALLHVYSTKCSKISFRRLLG